jgi:thiosulfate/3-mercaptopyruvate sulfurtransferase
LPFFVKILILKPRFEVGGGRSVSTDMTADQSFEATFMVILKRYAHWISFGREQRRTLALLIFFCASLSGVCRSLALDTAGLEPSQLHKDLREWTVLDTRPRKDYENAHIPGALLFTWEDHVQADSSGSSYRFPTPERLASALGRMGIHETMPLVIYGDADKSWGGEGWGVWVLSWLGHKGPIRLLYGGIQSWQKLGYPVQSMTAQESLPWQHYSVALRNDLNIQAAQLDDKRGSWTVIDTRSSFEWLTGHLPNAIHIPWTEFYTGREHRPLSRDALKQLFAKHGVDPEKPVVFYCTAGVRSSYAWMVHTLSGLPAARNYSAGISDWKEYSAKRASRKGA